MSKAKGVRKNGYTMEYLKKYSERMSEEIYSWSERLGNASNLNEDVFCTVMSEGNRKIGRVLNVSTAPIFSCHNCSKCKEWCYDLKACIQYKNAMSARAKNYVLATKYREKYFSDIKEALRHRRTNKYFRWHVAGDILDTDYLERMIDIANEFPDWKFWTYTKCYTLVNIWIDKNGIENMPTNLSIMFSEWRGTPIDNPYNMPIFTVRFDGEEIDEFKAEHHVNYRCPGNCDICKMSCHGCIEKESTWTDAH